MERSEAISTLKEAFDMLIDDTPWIMPRTAKSLIAEAIDVLMQGETTEDPKARFDRFVCAVAQADVHGDLSEDDIAEQALNIMLAADKRWEEYAATTKGGEDDRT